MLEQTTMQTSESITSSRVQIKMMEIFLEIMLSFKYKCLSPLIEEHYGFLQCVKAWKAD